MSSCNTACTLLLHSFAVLNSNLIHLPRRFIFTPFPHMMRQSLIQDCPSLFGCGRPNFRTAYCSQRF